MKKQQLASISHPTTRKCCEDVREALIDLFINVKIRNDQSMYDITSEKLEEEKVQLRLKDSLDLVESIRNSIEILISLKMDEEQMQNTNKSISSIKLHLEGREGKGGLGGINTKLNLDKDECRGYS